MEREVQRFSLKGYGTIDGIEIAHTVPGDQILFEMTRTKRLPKKGRLLEVVAPSQDRIEPKCIHARTCGGCCWQQMSYEAQLQEKQKRVEKAFKEPAKPILSSPKLFYYRNKMEFTFSENRAGQKYLGLMIAQAEPYVFNLSECHLTDAWFSQAVQRTRAWWEEVALSAYLPPKGTGQLRYLTLREASRTGEKMAILNVAHDLDEECKGKFVKAMQEIDSNLSLFLRIHQTQKGTPTEFIEKHLAGPDHIVEHLHIGDAVLRFKISPSSFFQPNTFAAEMLYKTAIDFLSDADTVLDLYCGTGALGMVAAAKAKQVIGIELNPESVRDARANCLYNQIHNVHFYAGDVGEVIRSLREKKVIAAVDAVILDPPRAGLDPSALRHLEELKPKKIIYISCNPLTQAENIEALKRAGYRLSLLQPIDQFPHTYHIENIALLER